LATCPAALAIPVRDDPDTQPTMAVLVPQPDAREATERAIAEARAEAASRFGGACTLGIRDVLTSRGVAWVNLAPTASASE